MQIPRQIEKNVGSLGHEKIETPMIYLEKIFEKVRHAIHRWKPEVFGEYL